MILLSATSHSYRPSLRAVGFIAMAMIGGVVWSEASAEATPAKQLQAAGSKASTIVSGDKLEAPCLVVPSMEVDVGTPVDGVVELVTVDRGDRVTRGSLLARLNSGVDVASIEYQTARAQFGARKLTRNEGLREKRLISNQELDEIETEKRLSELELDQKREQLKLRSIVSPIDGVIVDRYRNRGDLVKQEKIFRIAQLNPLHVEAIAPAHLFRSIRLGQSYQVFLPLLNIQTTAKVSNLDRVIDAASGTFRVRLHLPNPKYELPSGLRCQIEF